MHIRTLTIMVEIMTPQTPTHPLHTCAQGITQDKKLNFLHHPIAFHTPIKCPACMTFSSFLYLLYLIIDGAMINFSSCSILW